MQCPYCHEEVHDDALKCKYCKKLISSAHVNKKHSVWCTILSLVFACLTWFFSVVLHASMDESINCLTSDERDFVVLLCGMCAVIGLTLAFWSVKRRYTAWPIGFISLSLLGWSGWILWKFMQL